MRGLYVASTADRLELPCIVGTAREVAAFIGLRMSSFYCAVNRQEQIHNGYRVYRIDKEDKDE